jgi:hypothetical protein
MKKASLILALTMLLTMWGNLAFGQPPPYPQQPYYNPYYYPPPYNYYNYYSAPNMDPLSQFLYYVAPQIEGQEEREEWERQGQEYYEHHGHGDRGRHLGWYKHDRD